MVEQYLEHSKAILGSPKSRLKFNERRGLGRIYLFGYQNRYDLSEGFPLLTTKKMPFKMIANELIWFFRGDTNIKYLVDNKVPIWNDDAFNHNLEEMVAEGLVPDKYPKYSQEWLSAREEYVKRIAEDEEFAARWGDAGPIYGSQWIHWPSFIQVGEDDEGTDVYIKDPQGIDQIADVIHNMKKNPTSARHMVTAWNPEEVPQMALPPCHTIWQLNSDGEVLDLQLYQRACDMFLGVPFNIASYSMMNHIIANELDLKPGEFVHTFGDVHFYTGAGDRGKWYKDNFDNFRFEVSQVESREDFGKLLENLNQVLPEEPEGKEGMDHVTGILEQLQREPRPLPKVRINPDKRYNELTIGDFEIEGYDPHPRIKRTLAV